MYDLTVKRLDKLSIELLQAVVRLTNAELGAQQAAPLMPPVLAALREFLLTMAGSLDSSRSFFEARAELQKATTLLMPAPINNKKT